MTPTLKIGAVQMVGLAALGVLAGTGLKRRLPLLDRLNIPAPIVGGMLYAVAALVLRGRVMKVDPDVVLRDLPMVAFMTTIGLSARLQLIRQGGARVIWFLGIASLGAVLQNLLGMALAHALGVDARLGILTGSMALAGGPATALAFGGTFEKMGVRGAKLRWAAKTILLTLPMRPTAETGVATAARSARRGVIAGGRPPHPGWIDGCATPTAEPEQSGSRLADSRRPRSCATLPGTNILL